MRLLFKLIIVFLLVFVILAAGVMAIFYFAFFNVQPAEYPFLNEKEDIVSIEYAKFTFGNEGFVPEKVGLVLKTDEFMSELGEVDCHTGISIGDLSELVNGKSIEGIIINYSDGSFDFITPYLCVNSNFNPKGVADLLNMKIYGFDGVEFAKLLDTYAIDIPTDILEDFDGNIENLPDGIIPEELLPQE